MLDGNDFQFLGADSTQHASFCGATEYSSKQRSVKSIIGEKEIL